MEPILTNKRASAEDDQAIVEAGTTVPFTARGVRIAGPLLWTVEAVDIRSARIVSIVLFVCCVGILGIAVYLQPSAMGMGTHEQLGLAPCAAVVTTGYPCPTCGMTTAFAHTVRGQFLSAIRVQPAGFLLALGTVLAAGLSLRTLLTGRYYLVNWQRVSAVWIVVLVILIVIGGWGAKIAIGVMSGELPVRAGFYLGSV